MPFDLISGQFVPTRTNVWRDACDGQLDWLKQHISEGAPLNEADLCGDPPLILAAGGGAVGTLVCASRLRAWELTSAVRGATHCLARPQGTWRASGCCCGRAPTSSSATW